MGAGGLRGLEKLEFNGKRCRSSIAVLMALILAAVAGNVTLSVHIRR